MKEYRTRNTRLRFYVRAILCPYELCLVNVTGFPYYWLIVTVIVFVVLAPLGGRLIVTKF